MTLISRGALHKCQFTSLKGTVADNYFYVTGVDISNSFNPIRIPSGNFDFMQYQYQGSTLACSGVLLKDTDFFKLLTYVDTMTITGSTQLDFTGVRPVALSLQGGPQRMLSGSVAWAVNSIVESAPTTVPPTPGTITTPFSIADYQRAYTSNLTCDIDSAAQVKSIVIGIDYGTQYIGQLLAPVSPNRGGTLSIQMVKGQLVGDTIADVTAFTDIACSGNKSVNITSPKAGGKGVHFVDCIAINKQVSVSEPIDNHYYIILTLKYTFKNFEVLDNDIQQSYNMSNGWEFTR